MTDTQHGSSTAKARSKAGDTITEQVKQQTQQKAGELTEQAQEQATSLAQTQKDKASQSLNQIGLALQQTSQQLQQQGQSMPGQALNTAAQQMDRLTGYLESHDVQQIIADIEGFARRQPAAFLAGAFTAGFTFSRFVKSSTPPSDGMASPYTD